MENGFREWKWVFTQYQTDVTFLCEQSKNPNVIAIMKEKRIG